MKHFKKTTIGNIVVMGHNTYNSMGGMLLHDRLNIVLTTNQNYTYIPDSDIIFVTSIEYLFKCIKDVRTFRYEDADIYIIGGEQIYRQFEQYADEIILSEIPIEIEGDAYFPIDVKDESKWKLDFVEYRIDYTLRQYLKV